MSPQIEKLRNSQMPSSIHISDEDIQEIGNEFDCDFSDLSRRSALLQNTSMDVQACPGSGKTTLLVAKLAILAKKWRWRDRGILVLSHTNVAREEVEQRLARHAYGHKLLSYPHFAGTIQRFIDEFLALAFLKDVLNVERVIVDDSRFEKLASFDLERCHRLKTFLKKRHNGDDVARKVRFEYVENGLRLGCASGNYPFTKTTSEAYKELQGIKFGLTKKGFVRFDDMFAFAHEYLRKTPILFEAMRIRFPWVFIDEMQDTSELQDSVLQRLFDSNSIVQRFGDINQAIFSAGRSETAQLSFPGNTVLELSTSKRFGSQIANLCSPASAISSQELEGNSNRRNYKNTIILFNAQTISKVLPTFGRLIFEEFGPETGRQVKAKAVGFRKSPRATPDGKYLPHDIGDYWAGFDSSFSRKIGGEAFLIDYVTKARAELSTIGEYRKAYSIAFEGFLRLADELQLLDDNGNKITKAILLKSIKSTFDEMRKRFDAIMYQFCNNDTLLEPGCWTRMTKDAVALLIELFPVENPALANEFIRWIDHATVLGEGDINDSVNGRNIYQYRFEGFEVDIEVTTIHAVKGETHDATLILETSYKGGHDLRKALPFLSADGNECINADDGTKEHLKRLYVAMTRPRDLLCLTLLRDHLGPNEKVRCELGNRLRAKGWQIIDLFDSELNEEF